jgi:hypothetical protein
MACGRLRMNVPHFSTARNLIYILEPTLGVIVPNLSKVRETSYLIFSGGKNLLKDSASAIGAPSAIGEDVALSSC